MKKYITENMLTEIRSDIQFFNTKATLLIDCFNCNSFTKGRKLHYKGKYYLPVVLHGEPQNLIKMCIPFNGGFFVFESKDLPHVIGHGRLFDFSKYYHNRDYGEKVNGRWVYNLKISDAFMIQKCVAPFVK